MNSFILKSFKAGQSDFEDKGVAGSFKLGINLDIRKTIDSLSCQQTLIAEGTGVVVDTIRFYVPCIDGNTYGFGSSGKIYKRTPAGVYTVVYTDTDGAITGAAEWYCSNGKTYLFWATLTKLHCKEIAGAANWSDVDANVVVGGNTYTYPKSNLTSSTNHFMAQAVGSLQICNEDYLAMVGWDGSYTPSALNIFKKNYAKTLIERNNYVVIGAPKKDLSPESDLVSWDTDAGAWNDKKVLKGGAINAMVDTDVPLLQVGINGGIYYGDFQNVLPIIEISGGGYCNPGGVTNDGGLALFGIYGNSENRNGIYSYGKKQLNQDRALNLEYNIGDISEIGAVCKVGTDILVSYREGANYYAKKVDTSAKAIAYYYSLDLKPPTKGDYVPVWGPIMLTMKALPAGCKVECFYKLEKTGNFIQAKMENNGAGDIDSVTVTGTTEAIFLVAEKAKIFELELKLTPSGNTTPEIYKAEIFFE